MRLKLELASITADAVAEVTLSCHTQNGSKEKQDLSIQSVRKVLDIGSSSELTSTQAEFR